MKTFFYERTAYKLSEEPVPNCFFLLDQHFDQCFVTEQEAYEHQSVQLAENVCARMADIEMYAFLVADARKRYPDEIDVEESISQTVPDSDSRSGAIQSYQEEGHNTWRRELELTNGIILARSFLIGYLNACRVLLDGGAIVLTQLYNLPLKGIEQSLINQNFWHQLVATVPNVHRRYHAQRLFFNELDRWRNETLHRLPPVATLQMRDPSEWLLRERMQAYLLDEPSERLGQSEVDPRALKWIDPMLLHQRWKPHLLSLCERLCKDIEYRT